MRPPAPREAAGVEAGRLACLTGLRGIGILWIVVAHAFLQLVYPLHYGSAVVWQPPSATVLSVLMVIGQFGYEALAAFFVLSGYGLMRSVLQRPGGRVPGGIGPYLQRRARRLLPAYYVSLGATLALIALCPALQRINGRAWDLALPVTPSVVVSHLLLVHNLSWDWCWKINPPLWYVAASWQLALLFPALLLPLWRRWGVTATVAAAWGLGLLPSLFDAEHRMLFAKPWCLGLFAFGMLAAVASTATDGAWRRWSNRLPWGPLAAGLSLACVALSGRRHDFIGFWPGYDALAGAAVVCFLLWANRRAAARGDGAGALAMRLLEHRWLVSFGTISYSLLLIHFPVLSALSVWAQQRQWTFMAELGLLLGAGLPLAIGLAAAFHALVERPVAARAASAGA